MSKRKTLNVILVTVLVLMLTSIRFTVAQEQTENMQTFLDFRFAEIEIRVNATREALPEESMNITLLVRSKAADINLENLNLTVCGFIEGQNKTVLGRIYRNTVSLNYNETIPFNDSFLIPADKHIWGATYGELSLQYCSVGISLSLPSIGFTMTHVRNVYLENIEEEYQKLSEDFNELQQNYTWIEGNYTELKGNYTELKGKYDELSKGATGLDNTKNIAIILAVTTVVFGATTIYLIVRKPKQSW